MSSGFISGGTAEAPPERSDEWLIAQREIEANIQRKAIETRQQTDSKGLFETLEANKESPAAKQDAFEEANRLKNQFRALDEDEIEFLDSVLESTRAEEARVKRETAEGLVLFRRQQEEADKKAREGGDAVNVDEGLPAVEEESWVAGGRKRKRVKDKEVLKGVKLRKASSSGTADAGYHETHEDTTSAKSTAAKVPEGSHTQSKAADTQNLESPKPTSEAKEPSTKAAVSSVAAPGKGLVSYGSDDDDDW